jgi:transcriptional regulator with XRE-family HTH domain
MPERRRLLGGRLKAARQRARLSQGTVAESLGITRQALSAWETGSSCPSATQLAELATVYCECAHALLFGVPYQPINLAALMPGQRLGQGARA